MSLEAREASARKLLDNGWDDQTDIAWPDMPYTPHGAAFVRFAMANSAGGQASMGSPGANKYRNFGQVIVQVFTPEGDASKTCRQYADDAVDIFKGVETDDGIFFYNVFARTVGNDGRGYYQINVIAQYRYDDTV